MYYGCGRDRSVLVCQRIPCLPGAMDSCNREELVCVREPHNAADVSLISQQTATLSPLLGSQKI